MRQKQVPNWVVIAEMGTVLVVFWVIMDRHIKRVCVEIVRDTVAFLDTGR